MNITGVEFKSMPSGLHNVSEDLMYLLKCSRIDDRYFVMPPYAGLSACYRKDAPESERNARMVAIGVLVPSTGRYGRLGRAWNHAAQLKALARYPFMQFSTDVERMRIIQTTRALCRYTLIVTMIPPCRRLRILLLL